jgi:hypothetical protein
MDKDVLETFQSLAGIVRFLLLFMPGVVAVSVFDIRVPGERRKFSDLGVGLAAYSVLIDVAGFIFLTIHPVHFCSPLLADASKRPCDPWPPIAFFLAFVVVLPIAVGWFAVDFQRWLSKLGLALSPVPTAWDELFARLGSLNTAVAIVLTLVDGRKIGGVWECNGFVSTYPAEGDILIAVPCVLNQETGRIKERVAGARAMLVKRADILTIEIFDLDGMVEWGKEPEPPPAEPQREE